MLKRIDGKIEAREQEINFHLQAALIQKPLNQFLHQVARNGTKVLPQLIFE
jgi:hypothetical protein